MVHMMEEHIAACVRLDFRLAELARKYDHVRFLSLCATEARPHTDVDTLPLLVVYRGGEYLSHQEKVNSLPGVGDDLKLAGVEALLRQLGTKLTSSVALSARQQEQLERLQEERGDERDDDDDD